MFKTVPVAAYDGGAMTKRVNISPFDCAPPTSYRVLDATEFESLLAEREKQGPVTSDLPAPLIISTRSPQGSGYPAFQLDARLNLAVFLKLRQLYAARGASETFLWDFLRTIHGPLDRTTGIDFLLGFYSPAIAAMCDSEREEHFLELAELDIWAVLS